MAAKKSKKKAKKATKKKAKYVCYECGSIVTMDCCGIGFTRLVCCGKAMKKKASKKATKKRK